MGSKSPLGPPSSKKKIQKSDLGMNVQNASDAIDNVQGQPNVLGDSLVPPETSSETGADMVYRVLTEEQSSGVLAACASGDVREVQQYVQDDVLELSKVDYMLDQALLLDYYVSAVWWAGKEQKFTKEQLSAFYTIVHTLLENVRERSLSLAENVRKFKRMLIGVGVTDLPDGCVSGGLQGVFSAQQMKQVTDYLFISLFQHYELYKAMFHASTQIRVQKDDVVLEVPKPDHAVRPAPLCEAIRNDDYVRLFERSDESEAGDEESSGLSDYEEDLLSRLPAHVVCQLIDSVFNELVAEFQEDVKSQIMEKSNDLLRRINTYYKIK